MTTFVCDTQQFFPAPCAVTIGYFDGVHQGHRYLIEQVKGVAAERGICSAIITFSCHPRKVMNTEYQPQLLSTADEKRELLASLGVDYCIVLDFTPTMAKLTAREFMENVLYKQLNVHALVIGYDHRFGHNRAEGFDDYCRYGSEIGMEVVQANACVMDGMSVSSTLIRNMLKAGDAEMAARCLGYTYYLDGTVVSGYKVGRTIGFPTANLKVEDPDKLIPADGVYAVKVRVGGNEYNGMLDIGYRPTFNNGTHKSIEVHILDFSSDIYEYAIRVSFVKRLRADIKFSGVDELIAQLHKDRESVRSIMEG